MPFIGNKPTAVPLTGADIQDGTIGIADLSATGTKDSTTFLRGDNTFNTPPLGGITEADQWRLTANITSDTSPITSNLERVDNTGFGYIGTGMSVSSGIWTFPSTGIYLIRAIGGYQPISGDNVVIDITITTNNSSYTQVAVADETGSTTSAKSMCEFLFDVTDTANCKVKFNAFSIASGSVIFGNTNRNDTHFTFIRLGDT